MLWEQYGQHSREPAWNVFDGWVACWSLDHVQITWFAEVNFWRKCRSAKGMQLEHSWRQQTPFACGTVHCAALAAGSDEESSARRAC